MTEDVRLLIGLLAQPERMRVVAALTLSGAGSVLDIAAAAGLAPKDAQRALTRLESSGLVVESDGVWELRLDVLQDAARVAALPRTEAFGDVSAGDATVLRAFFRDGRLQSVPVQAHKRAVVLDHISRVFEVGVRYPEKQVDALLRAFYPDYAALRRYLVDGQFLSRDAGVYWRSGGSVEL